MRNLISVSAMKTGLTVAYLFSALAITVATSSPGKGGNALALGVTNYAISTTCPGSIGDMGIRANSGTIEKSIFSNGQATQKPVTYRNFGFPDPTLLVGLDQGFEKEASCKVVNKSSLPNNGYDESKTNQVFYIPGQLTTFTYQCTKATQNQGRSQNCQVTIRELPFGPIEDVYL
jgi:hypothetical protein